MPAPCPVWAQALSAWLTCMFHCNETAAAEPGPAAAWTFRPTANLTSRGVDAGRSLKTTSGTTARAPPVDTSALAAAGDKPLTSARPKLVWTRRICPPALWMAAVSAGDGVPGPPSSTMYRAAAGSGVVGRAWDVPVTVASVQAATHPSARQARRRRRLADRDIVANMRPCTDGVNSLALPRP